MLIWKLSDKNDVTRNDVVAMPIPKQWENEDLRGTKQNNTYLKGLTKNVIFIKVEPLCQKL